MVGRIKFYLNNKKYDFLTTADGSDIFFGENELASGFAVERDLPVEFEVRTNPTNWKSYAENVRCLNSSESSEANFGMLARFEGKVLFFHERKFGRIEFYDEFSAPRTVFFHLADIEPAEDGLQYEPVPGAVVEFERGTRHGKELAERIVVTKWPDVEQTIEEQFAVAEELPLNCPEPQRPSQTKSKLLRDHHKGKTLLELIHRKVKV